VNNNKWTQHVYAMELRKIITYRADFWVNFIGQTIFSIIISYYLWQAIFASQGATSMKGFSLDKIIFYYLMVPIISRIQQGEMIGSISREIYDGSLNKFLLYPMNFYKYKITTYFAHSTFYYVQLWLIAFVYFLFFHRGESFNLSISNTLIFTFVISISTLTYFMLHSITELIAFWADNIWSLGVITRFIVRFLGGALIPLAFFPEWAVSLLYYTPFPYLIHFPMKVLFGEIEYSMILQNTFILIFWTIFFYIISKVIWNKGKYSYTGVGI